MVLDDRLITGSTSRTLILSRRWHHCKLMRLSIQIE
ncbi:hypothetical protein M7I_3630 [Glarea lozoyensis 74030]|uniref:Uncharacterized protein n=1 Tax=Glarea lozoyensis (strain ATCC 74030 / MF5533) TaxID=1104152 RepID=H0EM04_GLAL7|nr:hypothetical protein M7I_3630 [Glarea lozoyensis 74030]